MIKKFSAVLVCILIVLSTVVCVYGYDSKIRMVNVNLPNITAELSGSVKEDDISTVKLDDEKLTVKDVYKDKDATKLVYMLVDISTSMSQSALDALKPSLISYAQSLDKESDKFVLVTFGEKIDTVLKGGESNTQISNAINAIKCTSYTTNFYSALNSIYKKADKETKYERKYAIVISDGADLDKGNSSQQEVVDNYKTHRLVIYGLCDSHATKTSSDGFGYIARNSGGELYNYSASNATNIFGQLKSVINDVTIVKLSSSRKKSVGLKYIDFELSDQKLTQEVLVKAKSDNKNPEIDSIKYDKDSNCFEIKFSEEVEKADQLSSYKIKKGGKDLTIVSVEYKNKVSRIYMEDKMYSGEYTFEFSSIVDASDNANELEKDKYTKEIEANPIILKILKIVGIVSIPLLFLLCIFLILVFLKKKKKVTKIKDLFITQEEEVIHNQVHIKEKEGLSVNFYIDGADGVFHSLNYNLISSVIVGRSDMCEIRIDDALLSNQHFAIEKVEYGLAVSDLGSTNGTFVNGVRIGSRTFLRNGDRISAGNSTIRITYAMCGDID